MPLLRGLSGIVAGLETALSPSAEERLVAAAERQAAALERLAELGELALGIDPASLAAAAERAAQPPAPVEVSDPNYADYRAVEALTLEMAQQLQRIPTDAEVLAELERREAVDAAAAAHALRWGQPPGGPGVQ